MKCILFIADAVRPDYLGCYGNPVVNTAAIDWLAGEGVRLDLVITAAPWTAPSIASLISGIYAYKHQIFTWDRGFAGAVRTLFHAFADHGHAVGSFVFDRDFLFSQMPFARVQGNTDQFDLVCGWVQEHAGQDFFLLIHSWATHMPYNLHHAARQEWKAAKEMFIHRLQKGGAAAVRQSQVAYRQAIEYASAYQVGRLLDLLGEQRIEDETLFIFAADHGESWGERFADKAEIKGVHHLHGRFLYDETLRVPLILRWPGRLPRAHTIHSQVRSVDLAPTLFDLAGFHLPTSLALPMDGVSLLPLLDGTNYPNRPAFSATSEHGILSKVSLRDAGYKYIYNVGEARDELYDLGLDPGERNNLAEQLPVVAQEMRARIEAELRGITTAKMTPEEEAVLLGRLEQLGYL
jgi:arylsulfatase